MKVVLYAGGHGRAAHIAQAMEIGCRRHGLAVERRLKWDNRVEGDVAIAYGWVHEPVFTAYRRAGAHYAYFDMGYFNRRPSGDKGGSREGHHRLAVNSWDTADTMARGMPADRWKALGISVTKPTASIDGAVLVAGMSDKAAGTHGFRPLQWENRTLELLRDAFPTQEVIYRPKPKNLNEGEPIASVLARTSIIVTHHSNVAVDGLVAGVPCHATKGVGKLASYAEMTQAVAIRGPVLTYDERCALLADVAYAQWAPDEMRDGSAWAHIRGIIDAQA